MIILIGEYGFWWLWIIVPICLLFRMMDSLSMVFSMSCSVELSLNYAFRLAFFNSLEFWMVRPALFATTFLNRFQIFIVYFSIQILYHFSFFMENYQFFVQLISVSSDDFKLYFFILHWLHYFLFSFMYYSNSLFHFQQLSSSPPHHFIPYYLL